MNAIALLALTLSALARAALQGWATSPTEQVGCLLGEVRGDTIVVMGVAPLAAQATAERVVPQAECPAGTLGRVHSHPGAVRCWYVFPGTVVPTQDGAMAVRSPFRVDAIVCGGKLVWTDKNLNLHEQVL